MILNELTFSLRDTISHNVLIYNRERIFSLGLFNKVSVEKITNKFINIVIIEVEESWYIFPLPFVEVKERDYKKLSYGVYLVYKNFRGRNETIYGTLSFGYNPTFGITYINPNLSDKGDYFLRFSSSFSKNKNLSIIAENDFGDEFDFKRKISSILIGRRLNPFNKIFVNLSFIYIEVEKAINNYTVGSERIDRYPQFGLSYEFDNRDLIQFPKQGNLFFLSTDFHGLGVNNISYQSAKLDFRQYLQIYENIFLKFRFASRFTFGEKVPFYDYSLIGSEEKIRGNFSKRIENRNLLILSTEMYSPLIKEMQIDFTFIPLIPKQLLSYRMAIYLQSFADYGTVFKEFNKSNNSLSGYGLGINFLFLPYNVIRLELGFDKKNRKEFIIDFETSF